MFMYPDALWDWLQAPQVSYSKVEGGVPVRRHLQAQRHLGLHQAVVLLDEPLHLLSQLDSLRLQSRQVLLPRREVQQEKEVRSFVKTKP